MQVKPRTAAIAGLAIVALGAFLLIGIHYGGATASPGESPALYAESPAPTTVPETCEQILDGGDTPPMISALPVSSTETLDDADFEYSVSPLEGEDPGEAAGEFSSARIVRSSEYFEELGCADDGFKWVVVQFRDSFEPSFSTDSKYSYTTAPDGRVSEISLIVEGESYVAIDVLSDQKSGYQTAVFEIPSDAGNSVRVEATLAYISILIEYGLDDVERAAIPAELDHSFMIADRITLDEQMTGCPSFEAAWC